MIASRCLKTYGRFAARFGAWPLMPGPRRQARQCVLRRFNRSPGASDTAPRPAWVRRTVHQAGGTYPRLTLAGFADSASIGSISFPEVVVDLLLRHVRRRDGRVNRHFYSCQLRDMKGSVLVELMAPLALTYYGRVCRALPSLPGDDTRKPGGSHHLIQLLTDCDGSTRLVRRNRRRGYLGVTAVPAVRADRE